MRAPFLAIAISALLAGCGTVPSYYSSRMTAPPSAGTAVHADEENPPRARDARRRAARSAPEVTASTAERTPIPASTPGASAQSLESTDDAQRRSEQRELQIKQRMNSICTGC